MNLGLYSSFQRLMKDGQMLLGTLPDKESIERLHPLIKTHVSVRFLVWFSFTEFSLTNSNVG